MNRRIYILDQFFIKVIKYILLRLLQFLGDLKSTSDDPLISRKRILVHISWGLDSTFFFGQHFLSGLEISKRNVFFLGTSSEYLTRYGQGSVFKIHFQGSAEIADPCLYFFEYSPDVLKN